MEIKTHCTNLLEEGNIKACLQKLTEILAEGDIRNDLSSLRGQYNRLLKDRGLGLIPIDDYRREENRIDEAVRDLVRKLTPTDILEKVFAETFLIICNADKRSDMETFFGKKYFPNFGL